MPGINIFVFQKCLHFLGFAVQKVNQEQRGFFPLAGASQHSRLFWLKGLIPSSGSMHYKRVLKTKKKDSLYATLLKSYHTKHPAGFFTGNMVSLKHFEAEWLKHILQCRSTVSDQTEKTVK